MGTLILPAAAIRAWVPALAVMTLAAVACDRPAAPATPPDLAVYLHGLAGDPEPARRAAVRGWRLDRAAWDATIVEPYRALHADYERAFEAAVPGLVEHLAVARPIVARAHFAGDPVMTRDQAVTRWALPTLAASRIAELGGRPPVPIEAVFVEVGGAWRAIVGIEALVRARIVALDPACAAALDALEPAGGRCIETTWAVADAALRDDHARFAHACRLAATACAPAAR